MDNRNFWKTNVQSIDYGALNENIEADVVIIGGGLAGVACAEALKKDFDNVCIIEADRICSGETANSSAIVTFAHDLIYQELLNKQGYEKASKYYEYGIFGMNRIREIADRIDCDLSVRDMVFFSTTSYGDELLKKELEAFRVLDIPTEKIPLSDIPFTVTDAYVIHDQLCINPYKFTVNLARDLHEKGVRIYEKTPVTDKPENGVLKIGNYEVKAKYFVIATHFPFINFPGMYFAKMYQSRSHNAAFKCNKTFDKIYESAEDNGYEFRPAGENVICGGVSVRTGRIRTRNCYKELEQYLNDNIDEECEIVSEFSAQDCITFDSMPFAGLYSAFDNNVFVVTGFNKWGFTSAMASADIVRKFIKGEDYESIFSPARLYALKSPTKYLKNISVELGEFAKYALSEDDNIDDLQPLQGKIFTVKGKRIGVYKTESGELKAVKAICTHLGCPLEWNATEKTWDCVCHGSRFDVDGKIISNPTLKELKTHIIDK